jgi:hypothetical protein
MRFTFAAMAGVLCHSLLPAQAASITLSVPVHSEDFNATAEGGLPAGWLPNNIPLDEMNPGSASLSRKERYWVKQSLKLNFKQPDRADEDTLNRIVWHSVKGVDTKYPVRFAGAHGRGLKKLKLVLSGDPGDEDAD